MKAEAVSATVKRAIQAIKVPQSVPQRFFRENEMPKPEIEQFLKLLITQVRDSAIESCDITLTPQCHAKIATRWRKKFATSPEELAREVIPDCIDSALFYLLFAIDYGVLRLSFLTSEGTVVDLTTDGLGELAGWYMGMTLIAQHSKQRYTDDNADLRT
jgi:hypothetical protein